MTSGRPMYRAGIGEGARFEDSWYLPGSAKSARTSVTQDSYGWLDPMCTPLIAVLSAGKIDTMTKIVRIW